MVNNVRRLETWDVRERDWKLEPWHSAKPGVWEHDCWAWEQISRAGKKNSRVQHPHRASQQKSLDRARDIKQFVDLLRYLLVKNRITWKKKRSILEQDLAEGQTDIGVWSNNLGADRVDQQRKRPSCYGSWKLINSVVVFDNVAESSIDWYLRAIACWGFNNQWKR